MKKIVLCLLFVPFFVFCDSVKIGDWVVDSQEDPITDQKSVRIFIFDSTKSKSDSAAFLFNCNSVNLTSFVINDLPKESERGDSTKIILRVDKNTPIEMNWTKGELGYEYSDINEVSDLIKNGKKLIIRDNYGKTKDFIFSLVGFAKSYEELKKNCPAN